jgi:hypothetical protein
MENDDQHDIFTIAKEVVEKNDTEKARDVLIELEQQDYLKEDEVQILEVTEERYAALVGDISKLGDGKVKDEKLSELKKINEKITKSLKKVVKRIEKEKKILNKAEKIVESGNKEEANEMLESLFEHEMINKTLYDKWRDYLRIEDVSQRTEKIFNILEDYLVSVGSTQEIEEFLDAMITRLSDTSYQNYTISNEIDIIDALDQLENIGRLMDDEISNFKMLLLTPSSETRYQKLDELFHTSSTRIQDVLAAESAEENQINAEEDEEEEDDDFDPDKSDDSEEDEKDPGEAIDENHVLEYNEKGEIKEDELKKLEQEHFERKKQIDIKLRELHTKHERIREEMFDPTKVHEHNLRPRDELESSLSLEQRYLETLILKHKNVEEELASTLSELQLNPDNRELKIKKKKLKKELSAIDGTIGKKKEQINILMTRLEGMKNMPTTTVKPTKSFDPNVINILQPRKKDAIHSTTPTPINILIPRKKDDPKSSVTISTPMITTPSSSVTGPKTPENSQTCYMCGDTEKNYMKNTGKQIKWYPIGGVVACNACYKKVSDKQKELEKQGIAVDSEKKKELVEQVKEERRLKPKKTKVRKSDKQEKVHSPQYFPSITPIGSFKTKTTPPYLVKPSDIYPQQLIAI